MSRPRAVTILGCAALAAALLPGVALASPAAGDGSPAPQTQAPAADLHWHPPGEEEALASREAKPILYFFTADWCAPCDKLKRELFDDPDRAAELAERFVPVEVLDTTVERGTNRPEVAEVVERYAVRSFPTLVVALPDGTAVDQQRGYAGADRAWSWLQRKGAAAAKRLSAE
ncbi:MAG: thioredoxin family protein [Acidobacteriota bacterium]